MQVNYSRLLRYPADAPDVRLERHDFPCGITSETQVQRIPPDEMQPPVEASVIFSAQHGDFERLRDEVDAELERSDFGRFFAEPESRRSGVGR